MSQLKELINHDKKIFKKAVKGFIRDAIIEEDADINNDVLAIGVDEVGRGPLAGPVCTAAYSIARLADKSFSVRNIRDENLLLLNDSKQVAKSNRDGLADSLKKFPQSLWSIDFQSNDKIDRSGITTAIYESMTNNIVDILDGIAESRDKSLNFPKALVIMVDGPRKVPVLEINLLAQFRLLGLEFVEQVPIVKGDGKSFLIAAASNIAKVQRDKFMLDLAKDFPQYSWDTNVGYGTAQHRDAIKKHGINQYHRKSFVKELV